MDPRIQELIERYVLAPHPEGGYYRQTYASKERVATPRGERPASTAIYFLLTAGTKSHLHRIKSDEVWHFYLGGPLRVVELAPDGTTRETVLGPDFAAGQKVQHVVPAGAWFGAYPEPGTPYSLVGCTVAPGFDFKDFELAEREALLKAFPAAAPLIERLCC